VKVKDAFFVLSGTKPAHYPTWDLPEVAFAGCSNVGKSSLINTLVQRKNLVKVSRTPGRTQLLNFFQVDFMDGRSLGVVDLPGYGFAKVPLSVKQQWGTMIETFMLKRRNLKAMILVMDIRRGIKDDDQMLLESLAYFGAQPILVFTKCDKLSTNERVTQHARLSKQLGAPKKEVILFSSHSGLGKDELWKRIELSCLPTLRDDHNDPFASIPLLCADDDDGSPWVEDEDDTSPSQAHISDDQDAPGGAPDDREALDDEDTP
jgi:GTP-binding protein